MGYWYNDYEEEVTCVDYRRVSFDPEKPPEEPNWCITTTKKWYAWQWRRWTIVVGVPF